LTALKHLDLSQFHYLGAHGASVLTSLTNLKHLNLSSASYEDPGGVGHIILAALKFLTGLQHLDLSKSDSEHDLSEHVSAALELLTGLQYLDLSENYFGRDAGEHIAHGLKSLTLLQYLDLSENYFESDGAEHVAPALMFLTALQHLDLSRNKLGLSGNQGKIDGAEHASAALKLLTGLTYLDLSENGLGHDGGACIASALMSLIDLKHLDLSLNEIGPQEEENVSAALKLLTGLQYLNLSGNSLGPDFGARVASVLICLTDLQYLSVTRNNFDTSTDVSVVCFCSCLPKFRSLHIDMGTQEFMKHFAFENPKNALDRAESYWNSRGQYCRVKTDIAVRSAIAALSSDAAHYGARARARSDSQWSSVVEYLGAFHPLYSLLHRAAAACHVMGPRDAHARFLQPHFGLLMRPSDRAPELAALMLRRTGTGSKMARVRLRRLLRFSCISSDVAARLCSHKGHFVEPYYLAFIIRRCLSVLCVKDLLSVYLFEPDRKLY
jgi:hypothetical protein